MAEPKGVRVLIGFLNFDREYGILLGAADHDDPPTRSDGERPTPTATCHWTGATQ
jgi:hypothetical protein